MPGFSILPLLAACSFLVTAGPVPGNVKRQLFTSYANTSLAGSSTAKPIQISQSSVDLFSSSVFSQGSAGLSTLVSKASSSHILSTETSSSPAQSAQASTAIIVQPIQATVLTHVVPGATFVNPSGKPLFTDNAHTLVSTSFITPTPLPQTSISPSETSQNSIPTTSEGKASDSQAISSYSRSTLSIPSSAIVASGNVTASSASHRLPTFSYSPEDNTGASLTSTTAPVAISQPSSSSVGPTSVGYVNSTSKSQYMASSTIGRGLSGTTPSITNLQSLTALPTAGASSPQATDSSGPALVIVTEYTTVYATPASKVPVPSSLPISSPLSAVTPVSMTSSSAQQTISTLVAISSTSAGPQESAALSYSSAPPALPSTSLPVPPLVIVTQYTTVTPQSAASTQVPGAPILTASASIPLIVTSLATSPVASQSAMPEPSSNTSQDPLPPAPTDAPSASPPAPPAPASSNSAGPLIVTPIAPNQIFTVTVTTTEKETVKETTTVTVTAHS